jgi:hypothetical protein
MASSCVDTLFLFVVEDDCDELFEGEDEQSISLLLIKII